MTNPLSLLGAQAKYGVIRNGIWSQEADFCQLVPISPDIGANWINSLTKLPVAHIYCNKDFPLLEALDNVKTANLLSELKTFDGCFEIRDRRAEPGICSAHSYAIAIDINAFENQMGGPSSFSPEFIECWTKAGLTWGGNFRRSDPMHFSMGF